MAHRHGAASGDHAPRGLLPQDMAPARALVLEVLGATPYADRILELLAEASSGDGGTEALVIAHEGPVVALALLGFIEASNGVWKLHTLLLSESVDVREAGDAMVRGVMERVRAAGGRSLLAELPADPVYGRTLSLLRASGFAQPGRIPDFFRDGVALLFLRRSVDRV